ncbi:uncharacterized protein LOC112184110 [Rosa chinensis]|uniref:uncharacterized protein LOC112184110 n=1 Tax=Rosa chinensis TaxID=74649 RepID=UPI000D08E068|nr:uncharacterized protein LOC112184110 [Rosa chinensis]
MDPILKYMVDGLAPDDKVKAWRLQLRSAQYMIMNAKLYRRSHCFPNLKCVTLEDGHKIMKDIHAGVCGNHAGSRSLAHKTLRAGYFWPTISALAQTISSSCHKCQMFGVPDTIVTDNGTQFDNDELRAYTENLGTRILYASLAHPQTNGQVEAINKIIKKILKKKLDEAKGL